MFITLTVASPSAIAFAISTDVPSEVIDPTNVLAAGAESPT
jgi:hypothetical protein